MSAGLVSTVSGLGALRDPFSVLDLAPLRGATPADAFVTPWNSRSMLKNGGIDASAGRTSQHAGHASAATAVIIGQQARRQQNHSRGSRGVMLPNMRPLVIAEQSARWRPCIPDHRSRPGPSTWNGCADDAGIAA